ncbi:MAG: PilZ domain-containing protein [Deltaproteobacteria bacterium]|nr:PilZ domain-containing protein [Deltaproteobacteria bacterium]
MAGNRTIKAKDLIRDIKSRFSATELMRRYKLSPAQVETILKELEKKVTRPADLYPRSWSTNHRLSNDRTRTRARHEVNMRLPALDLNFPAIEGLVKDISPGGVKVSGIEVRLGQERSLLIRPDETLGIKPILFDARCRWVSRKGEGMLCEAGFQIEHISEENLRNFNMLAETIAACNLRVHRAPHSAPRRLDNGTAAEMSQIWKCPACAMPQPKEYDVCPQCGIISSKYRRQHGNLQSDSHFRTPAPRKAG